VLQQRVLHVHAMAFLDTSLFAMPGFGALEAEAVLTIGIERKSSSQLHDITETNAAMLSTHSIFEITTVAFNVV